MTTYSSVGKPITRIDGSNKATGDSLYAGDSQLPRMLHCKLLRSPPAPAPIVSPDSSRPLAP